MSRPVVLITGALTGIGRATAVAFARTGAKVIVSGRRAEAGEALVRELRGFDGAEAEFVETDVRDEAQVRSLIEFAVQRFGRLDVAVNNAGTEGFLGPVTEQSPETYALAFDTNVLGTLLCMKYEMRVMLEQKSGSIINISSTMGSRGAANASMYVASKHAVEGLTKAAALEGAASGVRVNAIAPGPVETILLDRFASTPEKRQAMTAGIPAKRVGMPEEIAEAVLFLGSPQSSFVMGQIIGVNGGKTAF